MKRVEPALPARERTLGAQAAAKRLGITNRRLGKLAAAGKVRVVALPGLASKYVKADVEALAEALA